MKIAIDTILLCYAEGVNGTAPMAEALKLFNNYLRNRSSFRPRYYWNCSMCLFVAGFSSGCGSESDRNGSLVIRRHRRPAN